SRDSIMHRLGFKHFTRRSSASSSLGGGSAVEAPLIYVGDHLDTRSRRRRRQQRWKRLGSNLPAFDNLVPEHDSSGESAHGVESCSPRDSCPHDAAATAVVLALRQLGIALSSAPQHGSEEASNETAVAATATIGTNDATATATATATNVAATVNAAAAAAATVIPTNATAIAASAPASAAPAGADTAEGTVHPLNLPAPRLANGSADPEQDCTTHTIQQASDAAAGAEDTCTGASDTGAGPHAATATATAAAAAASAMAIGVRELGTDVGMELPQEQKQGKGLAEADLTEAVVTDALAAVKGGWLLDPIAGSRSDCGGEVRKMARSDSGAAAVAAAADAAGTGAALVSGRNSAATAAAGSGNSGDSSSPFLTSMSVLPPKAAAAVVDATPAGALT
ncbi:hypothetical protein Vretimale_9730, partial [Volvox reticuliferus]